VAGLVDWKDDHRNSRHFGLYKAHIDEGSGLNTGFYLASNRLSVNAFIADLTSIYSMGEDRRSSRIGSKKFVSTNYRRFRNLFYSEHEKKSKPIKGLEGMYSLKRLSEF